ncbi:MAG: TRAP transporter small permease [Clostridia bacterium]
MNALKKGLKILRDCVEIYIPVAAFSIMFLVFVGQIFCRYVLRQPIQWAYEVTVTCYLWTVVLGACYAQRCRSHVMFTLFYDKLPTRLKALTTLLGNGLIAFAMIYAFVPSVQFIDFMKMQETSVLKVGLNWVYMPYVVFMVMITGYMLIDIYRDARVVLGLASQEEIQAMLRANKSEVQEAIAIAIQSDDDLPAQPDPQLPDGPKGDKP